MVSLQMKPSSFLSKEKNARARRRVCCCFMSADGTKKHARKASGPVRRAADGFLDGDCNGIHRVATDACIKAPGRQLLSGLSRRWGSQRKEAGRSVALAGPMNRFSWNGRS
jgi:hypothetical protein